MSDFTVFNVNFPTDAKQRVIVNTDAKNEADDQYAILPIMEYVKHPSACKKATTKP
jgi:hypothetical protein